LINGQVLQNTKSIIKENIKNHFIEPTVFNLKLT
jgi:hypothetical protein